MELRNDPMTSNPVGNRPEKVYGGGTVARLSLPAAPALDGEEVA